MAPGRAAESLHEKAQPGSTLSRSIMNLPIGPVLVDAEVGLWNLHRFRLTFYIFIY